MIAVRLRTRRTVARIGDEDIEILTPEGVDPLRAVAAEPLRADAEQVYYVEPGAVPDGARRLRPTDVPRRDDLPESHPLRGKRVLSVVPAGYPDCTVDDEGRLVPVDADGKPVKLEPVEPVEAPTRRSP